MSALTYKAPIRVVSASTEPFKAREKFDYWHQVCQSEIFRIECEALPGTHFDAFARGVALENTSVINIGIAPHRAIRRPDEMIDAKARGVFALFVRSGELLFEQDGRTELARFALPRQNKVGGLCIDVQQPGDDLAARLVRHHVVHRGDAVGGVEIVGQLAQP